jgi:large subunit ribosomal protein L10
MAKTRAQKEVILAEYKEKLTNAYGIIVIDQNGLESNNVSNFKQQLNANGSYFNTVKNTIFELALKESGLPELDMIKTGSHAVIFSSDDIAGTAKLLDAFIKENKGKITLKNGILDGQVLSVEQVNELANMPTMEQSIAMIAGLLTNAMAGTVNVLEDSVRSVVTILDKAFAEEATS